MKREHVRMAGVMVVISLLWFVPGVLAEPFVGAYAGFSLAADSDFTSADFIGTGATKDLDLKSKVDNSGTFGGRVGYWFDALPILGVQFDLNVFYPEITIPEQRKETLTINRPFEFDVSVVTLGFSVLGRYSLLKGPDFPRGRLQPYLGIGPALFITSWDDQEDIEDDNIGSDTVVNGGLQFMAGLNFFIREKWSLFAEYKFTHHVTQIGGISEGDTLSLVGNQPFNISHLTAGISYSFY